MKTNINLLHEEFRPKFEWVCGAHLKGIILLVAILCVLVYSGLSYLHGQVSSQVNSITADIVTQQQTIEELSGALSARTTDPLLESKLANLKLLSKEKSSLFANIQNLTTLESKSFSLLFDDLSGVKSQDLWLEQFSVTPKTLSLIGKISKPNALPVWVGELSETQFFSGQTFNLASVERDETGLGFELISKPVELEQTDSNSKRNTAEEGYE